MKRSIQGSVANCGALSVLHFEAIKRFYNLRSKPFSMFLYSSVLQSECITLCPV